ncbi:MAG TPA: HEAT repeat domain-containing protein [Vicinamibacterales bacterium]|jgi:cyclophilin family peptidyl-prolyl cis-trans isomerase/HEAT repeat protein|nr:HEAT repeat domain-containing protein [Vicinamibacterales bacterium]
MSQAQGSRLKAYGSCSSSLKPAVLSLLVFTAACASAPTTQPAAAVKPPVVTWEEKLGWMLRLEDQRILRDPNPPAPVILVPATKGRPAIVAPPPPSDLLRLVKDDEARTRRRAALAIGRVGLAEGIPALQEALGDSEVEVRQMAAFALGLIGNPSARPSLLNALKDSEPIVQGRAAEALGTIGDKGDAQAITAMVYGLVQAGALKDIGADDLTYPLAPSAEAARLGLYALVRLGSFDGIASSVLSGGSGMPVSNWWPIAYALGRAGDARAVPSLMALLPTSGRLTAAFAARGLGALKAQNAAAALRDIVEKRQRDPAVIVESIRALAAMRDSASRALFQKILAEGEGDATLRLEAATALGALHSPESVDFLIDLMSDPVPGIRGAAIKALAATDTETFLTTLSGMDPDRDWTVRTAQAEALATLPGGQGEARLRAMLQDRDQRVIPAVLRAMIAAKIPNVQDVLLDRLKADDFVIRATAANGLAELKATGAARALFDAYQATAGDSTYTARAAILTALNTLDPMTARPMLQQALQDKDWALRVKAAMLLKEQGVTDTDAGMRPAPTRPLDDATRQSIIAPQFSPHAFVQTDRGTVEIELAIIDAPLTVANFIELARKGFFNGIAIHRVVPDFVIQDGDPRGDGEGGPGYTIRDELNELPYLRGTVGMALDWKDTGGSQWFITHSPQPHLDARYTVFGRVVNGIEVVDRTQPWDVVRRVQIWDGTTLR